MVDYTGDTFIMPGLVKLYECLCSTLDSRGLGDGCECSLLHGGAEIPGIPDVGKGYSWVALGTIFQSKSFPQPWVNQEGCAAPIAANVTVGVMRCYAIDVRGESPKDMIMYMDKQMADMSAMRAAILCCAQDEDWQISLGTYTPIGPDGGLYGGRWSLSIGRA